MGVDHGLGGKNGEKSRNRRLKKAKHIAAIAKGALTKKKEVLFDDAARVQYLTGFRKRKQERREYGHAMEILKTQKKKLDKRKEIRSAVNNAMQEKTKGVEAEDLDFVDDEVVDNSDREDGDIMGKTMFADEATTAMFGGAVSVVVDTGIAEEMDKNFQENIAPIHKKPINAKKEPTKLEKALSKARHNLHNAPKKKKKITKGKGDAAKELYVKATGSAKGGPQSRAGRFEKKKEKGAKGRGKGSFRK